MYKKYFSLKIWVNIFFNVSHQFNIFISIVKFQVLNIMTAWQKLVCVVKVVVLKYFS